MPVTKKKGAIFAIHADTPDKVCNTSTISSNFQATGSSTSPIKKGVTIKRKVLSAKQISQPRAFPSDVHEDGSDIKKPNHQSDDLVKPSILKPKMNVKPLAEKRHRMPSGDSPRAITSTATSVQTPAKKARVFDRSKNDNINTVTPIGKSSATAEGEDTGSPASRTRSKTKSRPTTSSRQRDSLVSPMTINTGTIKQKASTSRPSAKSVFQDTSDIENMPVPINKQVLDRRRGKDIIDLLEMAGEEGPEEHEMEQYERAYDEHMRLHRMSKEDRAAAEVEAAVAGLTTKVKGKGKGKGRAVRGDGPLVDVSEAYGASGSEPLGFREQRTCGSHFF